MVALGRTYAILMDDMWFYSYRWHWCI